MKKYYWKFHTEEGIEEVVKTNRMIRNKSELEKEIGKKIVGHVAPICCIEYAYKKKLQEC